jgi:hypothetical protein
MRTAGRELPTTCTWPTPWIWLAMGRRGHVEDHQREGRRVDFTVGGVGRKIRWQIGSSGVDGCLHVARGAIHVAAVIELQRNRRGAEGARGGHLGDAGNSAELALQRSCHRGSHDLRARAGELCRNRNGGKIYLWQRGDRKLHERHATGNDDRHRHQDGSYRPLDEEGG